MQISNRRMKTTVDPGTAWVWTAHSWLQVKQIALHDVGGPHLREKTMVFPEEQELCPKTVTEILPMVPAARPPYRF